LFLVAVVWISIDPSELRNADVLLDESVVALTLEASEVVVKADVIKGSLTVVFEFISILGVVPSNTVIDPLLLKMYHR